MGSSRVIVNDKPFRDMVLLVKSLGRKRVRVGVLTGGEQGDIAFWMEYGVPSRNIPSRPFLRATFALRRDEIIAYQTRLLKLILQGVLDETRALGLLGEYVASLIKELIVRYGKQIFVPLALATIQRKGSDKPLVDTAGLLNSITWEIVEV